MAILNSIRKRGVFLIIIIALALFAFVLDGVINKGTSSQKGETNIATVNGTDIPREGFMQQVETAQRSLGGGSSTTQAMNVVWERELRRTLLNEQYESLGLSAEKEQISNSLRLALSNNPVFQNEAGLFDEGKMQEYLADIKSRNGTEYQQWLDFESNITANVLETNYFNLVKGGLSTTLAEGEQEYRFENDKINIEYIQIPYAKIADEDITITDAEIEQYVKSHASSFEIDPQADIQYVTFSESPSQADIDEAKIDIESLLQNKVEYNAVTKANDTLPGFKDATDNQDFVNANSDQQYLDRWMFKTELPNAIKDTISSLAVNSVYGPYKVDASYNLTKLIGKKQLPDSAKARHILIPFLGATRVNPDVTQTEAQAKATADSLQKVLKSDVSKFASLVEEFSSDISSVPKGGSYDWFGYSAMVPEFRDYCFEMDKGSLGVVKTEFGFHIIEVEDQKNFQDVVKVATVTKSIEPSEKTLNDVFSNATKFELEAAKGDFEAIATEKSINVRPVNKIGELDANIPGIGNNRSVVKWAFQEDVKIGDVKRFSVPDGYVIAQVTRRNAKALMSIAEASITVSPILRNEKKAKMIRESISSTNMNEIATNQNVTVKSATALTMASPTIAGAGTESKVVGASFGKEAGENTQLIDGKSGVFMVRVLAVNKAPDLEDYSAFANQLNAKTTPSINSSIYQALKKAAVIEDNRSEFY
ncbi:MAG: peptidylprolyl isomerase [Flavobacteriaceae bacterium]|nr:peptidylprolyl isomerase [Flavobacteriaceae bacterium]